MRFPHTIPSYILEAYGCSAETALLPNEQRRTLKSEDSRWDADIIPSLKLLALYVIASNWEKFPILEELPTCNDKNILYEILSTDLPFELAITKIENEHYWKRAAKDRWLYNSPKEHGNSWRQLYCERYFAEYLEDFEPSYFESQEEECTKLINLVKHYVQSLRLRALKSTKKPSKSTMPHIEDACKTEEDFVEHIPMSIILSGLPWLIEISLNFGMVYMNDGFEWRDFEFSIRDCVDLGKGLEACQLLKKFSLTRSNLDQPRAAALLQGLVKNSSLQELDLSHCKLADIGAHAVAQFLSIHPNLTVLRLANNGIGSSGAAGIVYGLSKRDWTTLKHLDLRLNPLKDDGGSHICAILLRSTYLKVLDISGCELGENTGIGIAEILDSNQATDNMRIYISNNNFGPKIGKMFHKAMKVCKNIVDIDIRMCNFTKENEYAIAQYVLRNRLRMLRKDEAHRRSSLRTTLRYPRSLEDLEVVETRSYAKTVTTQRSIFDEEEESAEHKDVALKSILRKTSDKIDEKFDDQDALFGEIMNLYN